MFRIWLRRLFQRSSRATGARRPSPRQRPSRPRLEMLEDRTLLSAGLVRDLNATGFSASPSGFANLNGSAYFFADDGVHGVELWKSDGTTTQLVKDINAGPGSSSLPLSPPPVVLNNALYFFASDGTHGPQLWTSDGTNGGTVVLTSGAPGTPNFATQVAAANGLIFFADPATNELWETDGSPGGTTVVTDSLGNTIDSPFDLTNVGGSLYFSGNQAGTQAGLWKTDGTPGGTSFVQAVSGSISDLTDVGGTAYFVAPFSSGHGPANVALWKSGSLTPLHAFGPVSPPGPLSVADLTAFNGKLYFAADDHSANPDAGVELWTSDGSPGGTQMLKDINPGTGSGLSLQANLTSFNGSLFFIANDGSGNGAVLWQSDGTAGGTAKVVDGNGHTVAAGGILSGVNTDLYFAGSNATGSGLWKTDGTAGGTVLVQSIPLVDAAVSGMSTGANGMLFFSASDGTHGLQLWTSNDASGATAMAADISPATDSNPQAITDVNGTAYFLATDGINGTQLWKSDGTFGGTQVVKSGLAFAGSPRLLNVNGTLYFFAFDGNPANGTVQLWKSNGTTAGTQFVMGFTPSQTGPFGYLAGLPDTLTNVNGEVFFVVDDGSDGLELWKSNGTAAGTALVKDLNAGPSGSNPGNLTAVGSTLYFTATDGTNTGLWKTDGTTTTFLQSGASNLLNVGGTLAFTGPDPANPSNGPALWKVDGSTITLVKSLGSSSSPGLLTNVNGALAFVVDNGGNETLWTSNGTSAGTGPLHTFSGTQSLSELTALGNTLYFINNAGASPELWKSNGSVAGTVRVTTLQSAFSPAFFDLTNVNGTLAFEAFDATHGQELWTSNGTAAGTVLAQDIVPGSAGSFPHDLATVGGRLFLAANDGAKGSQLFADLGSATRLPTVTVLGESASTVTLGQPVTFTALVRPPHGNVDGGNVTFLLDGQTVLGTVPVNSSGVATSTQILGVGAHSVVAIYGGDLNFTGSISAPVGVSVVVTPGPTATATTLSADHPTVVQGQSITFTAKVSPTPDGGNVDFRDGSTDLGMVQVNANGVAVLSKVLDLGAHNVIALYLGDAQFSPSTSPSVGVTVTVANPAVTHTTLTASAASVVQGTFVTFTATVRPGQGNVDGGNVDFMDGTTDLGLVPVDADGIALLSQALPLGQHNITAVYSGDADFSGSTSSIVHVSVVDAAHATTTTLSANPTTVVEGQFITFTATVKPPQGNVNGGNVDFMDGSTDLGTAGVNAQGVAVLSQALPLGPHDVVAIYSGDAQFAGSTSSDVSVTVEAPAATTTTLGTSATSVPLGDAVTLTATVKPTQGGNVDGGEVEFKEGTTDLGVVQVNASGVAVLSHAFAIGPHDITADYLGDIEFTASDSSAIDVTVTPPAQPLGTTTILATSATSLNAGESVTLTAAVSGHANGNVIPVDGSNMLFMDNGVLFASEPVNMSNGTAVLTTTLPPGMHNITAVYFGDANFMGSTSSPVQIAVAPPFVGNVTPTVEVTLTSVSLSLGGPNKGFTKTFTLQNIGEVPLLGKLYVVVHGLKTGITLRNAAGFVGRRKKRSPYVIIDLGNQALQPNDVVSLKLRFNRRPNPVTLSIFANSLS
jgi:ELWxxDGT repeat protein